MLRRVLLSTLVVFVGFVLVTCGGDSAETKPPTAMLATPAGEFVTATPEPTPDPTAGFSAYTTPDGYFTAMFPDDWATLEGAQIAEEQESILTILPQSNANSQPRAGEPFAGVWGIRMPVSAFRNSQHAQLQEEFLVQFMGLFSQPESDWRVLETNGYETLERDYYASPNNFLPFPTTLTVRSTLYDDSIDLIAAITNADFPDEENIDVMRVIFDTVMVNASAENDASDAPGPTAVLELLFAAARDEDFSQLAGLCDPQGENDGDTASICDLSADHPEHTTFIEQFSTGKVVGEARIDGDSAEVDFIFGPDGDWSETMTLIERDGRWYLLDF